MQVYIVYTTKEQIIDYEMVSEVTVNFVSFDYDDAKKVYEDLYNKSIEYGNFHITTNVFLQPKALNRVEE
jgi:hypothetical protein